ncbi:MAG: hypothetical protein NTZ78_04880 [Candidatus Aureabacteria bacterium]|nr:hypothetical protein [Candidatus Auribacterota bacterium]
MKRNPSGVVTLLAFCTAILLVCTFANAVPANLSFPQRYNFPFSSDLGKNDELQQPSMSPAKIGRISDGHNLIWGESVGWVNFKATHSDLKIGSDILAGWIWFENCGWVCLGEGHPLDGKRYSNRIGFDWGINNDGKGNLSGFAWSEVTGWINFQTSHSRVHLDESGQFYGYVWGENVGWMHFGLGRSVRYFAKADPGPWEGMGAESRARLAGSPDDTEICGGSVPVTGLNNNYQKCHTDAWAVCKRNMGRDELCGHIRCCDIPVYNLLPFQDKSRKDWY